MTYLFPELAFQYRPCRDQRDWFEAYQAIATEAELAADAVRAACEAYKADRSQENAATYAVADRRYDAARLAFQLEGGAIVRGVRAIAGIARRVQLAGAMAGSRML